MNARPRFSGGFSLIEILLVLASATILLASVDTWLEEYRVRSHVTDALMAAETARSSIVMTCSSERNLEKLSNEDIAHTFPHSPYVQSITVSGTCDKPMISVQTVNTGLLVEPLLVIEGAVTGSTFNWSCSSTGMQADVPKRCRGIKG